MLTPNDLIALAGKVAADQWVYRLESDSAVTYFCATDDDRYGMILSLGKRMPAGEFADSQLPLAEEAQAAMLMLGRLGIECSLTKQEGPWPSTRTSC